MCVWGFFFLFCFVFFCLFFFCLSFLSLPLCVRDWLRLVVVAFAVLFIWATSWQNQRNGICAQRRLRSAWASVQSDQSSLCAQWVAKDPSFLHADIEVSDQTGRMPRLIWVFAGRTCHLLVLSWGGSFNCFRMLMKKCLLVCYPLFTWYEWTHLLFQTTSQGTKG